MADISSMEIVPIDRIKQVATVAEHGDALAKKVLQNEVLSLKPRELEILANGMCAPEPFAQLGNSCSVERDQNGFIKAFTFNPSIPDRINGAQSVQANVKGPETIVIAAPDNRPFYAVGSGAHVVSEVAAAIDSVVTGAHVLDKEPKNPKELVDELLAESKRAGKPLGDIVIASHGEAGAIDLGNDEFPMDSPEFLSQFSRLRGHIAKGARIIFDGCSTAARPIGRETMELVANVTDATVRGYTLPQISTSIEGLGPYIEATPDLTADNLPPSRGT